MKCELCGKIVSEENARSCDEVEDSKLCLECYSKITSDNVNTSHTKKNMKKIILVVVFVFFLIFVIVNPTPSPKSYTKIYYLALIIIVVMGFRLLEKKLTAHEPNQNYDPLVEPYVTSDNLAISNSSAKESSNTESPSGLLIALSFFSPIIFGGIAFILGIPIAGIFVLGFVYLGACFGSVIGIIASLNWLAQRFNKLIGLFALSVNVSTFYYISTTIHLFG